MFSWNCYCVWVLSWGTLQSGDCWAWRRDGSGRILSMPIDTWRQGAKKMEPEEEEHGPGQAVLAVQKSLPTSMTLGFWQGWVWSLPFPHWEVFSVFCLLTLFCWWGHIVRDQVYSPQCFIGFGFKISAYPSWSVHSPSAWVLLLLYQLQCLILSFLSDDNLPVTITSFQGGCGVSCSGDIQGLSGHLPGQPAPGNLLWQGLDLMLSGGPFQPLQFCHPVKFSVSVNFWIKSFSVQNTFFQLHYYMQLLIFGCLFPLTWGKTWGKQNAVLQNPFPSSVLHRHSLSHAHSLVCCLTTKEWLHFIYLFILPLHHKHNLICFPILTFKSLPNKLK